MRCLGSFGSVHSRKLPELQGLARLAVAGMCFHLFLHNSSFRLRAQRPVLSVHRLRYGFSLSRRNSTSELSLGIHDKRSSVQIAACGECSSGLSIEQVVTSTHSESSASWIKIGVPQQPANDLSRSACWT